MTIQRPPTRYTVKEKGGRLVVIDNETGMAPLSARERLSGSDPLFDPGPDSPSPVSDTLSTQIATRPAAATNFTGNNDRQGRIIMLLVLGMFAAVFLFFTGAWIPITIALLVPPVRRIVWIAAKRSVTKFLNAERN
jgi:hypothetical protein